MTSPSFRTSFTVDRSPDEVFAAINDVRGWWGGTIDGPTAAVGDVFTYRYEDAHRSVQRITELVPGKRVVWHVDDAHLSFTKDTGEWAGTDIIFDIEPTAAGTLVRFTHDGLVPEFECFTDCSAGWTYYAGGALRHYIASRMSAAANNG